MLENIRVIRLLLKATEIKTYWKPQKQKHGFDTMLNIYKIWKNERQESGSGEKEERERKQT